MNTQSTWVTVINWMCFILLQCTLAASKLIDYGMKKLKKVDPTSACQVSALDGYSNAGSFIRCWVYALNHVSIWTREWWCDHVVESHKCDAGQCGNTWSVICSFHRRLCSWSLLRHRLSIVSGCWPHSNRDCPLTCYIPGWLASRFLLTLIPMAPPGCEELWTPVQADPHSPHHCLLSDKSHNLFSLFSDETGAKSCSRYLWQVPLTDPHSSPFNLISVDQTL